MFNKFLKQLIFAVGIGFGLFAHAAPYKVSFSGVVNQILNEGQLSLGDVVSGDIYYDTELVDVDPYPGTGRYAGAFARVTVNDLYFEFSGYMYTNELAVFSFQSQTPTVSPAEVTNFVEFGFYVPVIFGYGAELPTNDDSFDGLPEAALNFQSVRGGAPFYDVVSAHGLTYQLSPVPEANAPILFASGWAVLFLMRIRRIFYRSNGFSS